MTTTTHSTSATPAAHSRTTRRTARSLALTVGAAAAATLVTAGLGLGPTVAQADPGDTFVAIGSSQLVQSEDLASIQVKLDTESVVLNRDRSFSSCLGEGNRWTEVLVGSPRPVTATWTSRRHHDRALYESIAQAKTPAQATRFAKTLLAVGVRSCQGSSTPYDFHYGPTESSRVGSGYATWAVSYRGSSTKPDGGVVVFRKGTDVGFIQVSGSWGPADQMMESVAKVAVSRLVG